MSGLLSALRRGLRTLFGEFHWQAPEWASATAQRLRSGGNATLEHARANPRRSALLAVATLAVLAGGSLAWNWYQSRPKPETVGFKVTAPERTCYECVPAGKPYNPADTLRT